MITIHRQNIQRIDPDRLTGYSRASSDQPADLFFASLSCAPGKIKLCVKKNNIHTILKI